MLTRAGYETICILNRFYISQQRSLLHISRWIVYTVLVLLVGIYLPKGLIQTIGVISLAICLMIYNH